MILGLCAACLWLGLPDSLQTQTLPGGGLTGTVKSFDGKPMEGVAVSARAQGKTVTTSVWTNQNGEYDFPPLEDGQYRIWAQATGFDRGLSEQAVTPGKNVTQNFTLKAAGNFEQQLSDAEWLESLPGDTPEDKGVHDRMKKVLITTCSTCHQPGFVVSKRFDRDGWEMIVNKMGRIIAEGDPPEKPGGGQYVPPQLDENGKPMGVQHRLWAFRKNDIIDYLVRVRGPKPFPLKLKPFPRPTGEATGIVVTEYDVPNNTGTLSTLDTKTGRSTRLTLLKDGSTLAEHVPPIANEYRSGSDWTWGTRSDEQEGAAIHDIALGTDGNIYYDGLGLAPDPRGYIWSGTLMKLDVATQKLQRFPRPQGLGGNFANGKAVDSKGYVWGSQPTGLFRVDPGTGEYTEFKALTPFGRSYDMAIDREEKIWFAQLGIDKLGVVDSRTGDISEVVLPPSDEQIHPGDRENGQQAGGGWNMNAPLYAKGPRRMGADPNGDFVWVGEYWAGRLAKIDIHTKKVTEYAIPQGRYAHPYKIVVDKDHMVWFGMANADLLGKFNPFTETFTMYPLPTRGSNSRHLILDTRTEGLTLWVPYTGAQKIAKVQFRANTAR